MAAATATVATVAIATHPWFEDPAFFQLTVGAHATASAITGGVTLRESFSCIRVTRDRSRERPQSIGRRNSRGTWGC